MVLSEAEITHSLEEKKEEIFIFMANIKQLFEI